MTFEPHPAAVLRPGRAPLRLCDAPQRSRLLKEAGADAVVLLEPTRQLLDLSPEAFVRRLEEEHRPAAIVEGADFRFGAERRGDTDELARLGE